MADPIFPVFSEGVGYGIVIGLGGLFAILISLTAYAVKKYMAEVQNSEMYLTAKRSVRSGLIASSVVSSWTLSATLLSSTNFGCSVPILTFAVLAIELKCKAPNAHTFLELVKHRYGAPGHIVLAIYSLIYQIFISVNLLVGGASVFHITTGMHQAAVCFFFPLGVCIHTFFGGIKATFLTEWVHTVILFVIMLVSMFSMYAAWSYVGSSGRMWELLMAISEIQPVAGNFQGHLLTMKSVYGGPVGLTFLGGGFSATVDSQLFQKAIAADPKSTIAGYLLGSLCWLTIPFCISTTFGLGAAALEDTGSWPSYPDPMPAEVVSNALEMPRGVLAVPLMLFQAITSALSSETVAVTSLVTYDLYRAYIKPSATGKELILIFHVAVVVYSILVACVAVGLCYANFYVSFIVTAIGIIIDGAVIPSACTLFWRKQSKYAVTLIGVVYRRESTVSVANLSDFYSCVAGNMLVLTAPIVLPPLVTYLHPLRLCQVSRDRTVDDSSISNSEKAAFSSSVDQERIELLRAPNIALSAALYIAISMTILWPIPMYGTGYIFSKGFFTGWIVFTFIWGFFGATVITCLPLWQSRQQICIFFAAALRGSVAPLLAFPAKGWSSVAACGAHEPPRLSAVNDRKYRPLAPIASTIMRYWLCPSMVYTWTASNRFSRVSLRMISDSVPKSPGKSSMGILAL
ncbi:hypothetical protein BDV19DRAFT_380416 [Aspergillus venezuelensis]